MTYEKPKIEIEWFELEDDVLTDQIQISNAGYDDELDEDGPWNEPF